MRPLHRPVHPKFVYNSQWVKMSDEERKKALDDGIIRIPTPNEFRNMKSQELYELRAKCKPYFEEIKEDISKVLKLFPRTLFLAFR